MAVKLLKWGNGVGLLIPSFAAQAQGFRAGSFVRVIILEKELRIRPTSASKVDDYVPYDEYLDQKVKKELGREW